MYFSEGNLTLKKCIFFSSEYLKDNKLVQETVVVSILEVGTVFFSIYWLLMKIKQKSAT